MIVGRLSKTENFSHANLATYLNVRPHTCDPTVQAHGSCGVYGVRQWKCSCRGMIGGWRESQHPEEGPAVPHQVGRQTQYKIYTCSRHTNTRTNLEDHVLAEDMFDAAYHIFCLRLSQFDWLVGGPEQWPKLRKLWYACKLLCRRHKWVMLTRCNHLQVAHGRRKRCTCIDVLAGGSGTLLDRSSWSSLSDSCKGKQVEIM